MSDQIPTFQGMCPHCGRIVELGPTLIKMHADEQDVICPGAYQKPRNPEADARPLWNGQPNPHIPAANPLTRVLIAQTWNGNESGMLWATDWYWENDRYYSQVSGSGVFAPPHEYASPNSFWATFEQEQAQFHGRRMPGVARFVAFCNRSGWGGSGDVVGSLLTETPDGWVLVAQHVSSNDSFSKHDLRKHFDRNAGPLDLFEWYGVVQDPIKRWPAAPQPETPEEGE